MDYPIVGLKLEVSQMLVNFQYNDVFLYVKAMFLS